jgi:hypothetical protein
VLVDSERRVLLVDVAEPASGERVWTPPAALELDALGFGDVELEREVWRRGAERHYVARTEASWAATRPARWWSRGELTTTREAFRPAALPRLVLTLLSGAPPQPPFELHE